MNIPTCTGLNCDIREMCEHYRAYMRVYNDLSLVIHNTSFIEPKYRNLWCENYIKVNDNINNNKK